MSAPFSLEQRIGQIVKDAVRTSNENRLFGDAGEAAWGEPLVGFAAGAAAGTTRRDQREQTRVPADRWISSRGCWPELTRDVHETVVTQLAALGVRAVAPEMSECWQTETSPRYGHASRWSQRHTAFVAGLGALGLNDGLITPVGQTVRAGSVVVGAVLTPTPSRDTIRTVVKPTSNRLYTRIPRRSLATIARVGAASARQASSVNRGSPIRSESTPRSPDQHKAGGIRERSRQYDRAPAPERGRELQINGAVARMKLPEKLQFIANARMPQKTTDQPMNDRLCVVTGATSGVGYQAARRLARGGARLVLICRDGVKARRTQREIESTLGVDVEYEIADFTRLSEVRRAAERVLQNHRRIDLLVNNAGVHCTRRRLTPDGHETALVVNHLASFLLTSLLLDRLKESAPARIIQVNSQGHRFGGLDVTDLDWKRRRYHGLQGYGASKTAQLLTVWEFAERLADSGVTINAMHPGSVKTNIGNNNGTLYRWYSAHMIRPFLKKPEIAGEAIYYLAAAPEMQGVSGRFFNLTIEEKPAAHALDRDMGRTIWNRSKELVGIGENT